MERAPSTATILLKTGLTGTQGKDTVVALAEVAPHCTGSPHFQTGDEVLSILAGSMTFTLDGKPDMPLKAGATCHIPAKQVHCGKTASASVKFLSILVQERGTPRLRLDAA